MDNLNYFCCPVCKLSLAKKDGNFSCQRCKKKYKTIDKIPILVDMEEIPDHLAGQIRYFEKENVIENDEFRLYEWQKKYLERFYKNFPDVKGKTILDCGAGSGYMSVGLAKRGAKVFVCDLTLKGLKRLQRISDNLNLSIETVCCSAEDLPFKNNVFDYFISNAVLEHIPREKDAITEINRVCKNRAGLMVAVPLSYRFLNPFLLPINYIHDKKIGHLRRYDKKKLGNKFKGWNIQNVYYTGHTKKVIKTLINIILRIFDDLKIENEDERKSKIKLWASNICVIFRRK